MRSGGSRAEPARKRDRNRASWCLKGWHEEEDLAHSGQLKRLELGPEVGMRRMKGSNNLFFPGI